MTDEILKRIDAMAAKLGVTAGQMWGVLVKQARIEAIEDICWGLFWLMLAAICARIAWKGYKSDEDLGDAVMICGSVVGIIFMLVAMGYIAGTPGMLLNPQYWALKELLKAVGK